MGVEIVRVPPDFEHPTDADGDVIPGAHHEPLYYLDPSQKTGFQIYENVTEGTPQSPVFADLPSLREWLSAEGWPEDRISFLMEHGDAPSFIARI